MTIEEILAGESKNVEFKENVPEKSIKYMKSVVAFANGTGGKIIFGIADKTREVVGFDKEDVFKKMDAIANAVSDSCEPAIIPDITLQTVDGKTVIVVEVSEGRQRPYYIKALGRDGGVYVRVAGTTRIADEYMVKELLFEGSNRYYDQALCTGLNVTGEDIDALCKDMKEQAVKNARTEEQKASIKDVGRQQLRSWGVLIERDGKDYPSNAFAILTGNGGLHVQRNVAINSYNGSTQMNISQNKLKCFIYLLPKRTGIFSPVNKYRFRCTFEHATLRCNMKPSIARMFMRFHRMPFVS